MRSLDIARGLGMQTAFLQHGIDIAEVCYEASQTKSAAARRMGDQLGAAYLAVRSAPAQVTKLAQVLEAAGCRVLLPGSPAMPASLRAAATKTASWDELGFKTELHGEAAMRPWYEAQDAVERLPSGAPVKSATTTARIVYGPDGEPDYQRSQRWAGYKLGHVTGPEQLQLARDKRANMVADLAARAAKTVGRGFADDAMDVIAKLPGVSRVADGVSAVRGAAGNAVDAVRSGVGDAAEKAVSSIRENVPGAGAVLDAGGNAVDAVSDAARGASNAVNAVREKLPSASELGETAIDAFKADLPEMPRVADRMTRPSQASKGLMLGGAGLAGGTLTGVGAGGLYYLGKHHGAEDERDKPALQRLLGGSGSGGFTGALAGAAKGFAGL